MTGASRRSEVSGVRFGVEFMVRGRQRQATRSSGLGSQNRLLRSLCRLSTRPRSTRATLEPEGAARRRCRLADRLLRRRLRRHRWWPERPPRGRRRAAARRFDGAATADQRGAEDDLDHACQGDGQFPSRHAVLAHATTEKNDDLRSDSPVSRSHRTVHLPRVTDSQWRPRVQRRSSASVTLSVDRCARRDHPTRQAHRSGALRTPRHTQHRSPLLDTGRGGPPRPRR